MWKLIAFYAVSEVAYGMGAGGVGGGSASGGGVTTAPPPPAPVNCTVVEDGSKSSFLSCVECAKRRPRKGKAGGCAFDASKGECTERSAAVTPITRTRQCTDPKRDLYPCLAGCCHDGKVIGVISKQNQGLKRKKRANVKACYLSCSKSPTCEMYTFELADGFCTHYRTATRKGQSTRAPKFSVKKPLQLKYISGTNTCDPDASP